LTLAIIATYVSYENLIPRRTMIVASNLVLRFLLELAGLAALGYVGFQVLDGPAGTSGAEVAR
jgi:hypothetical protein